MDARKGVADRRPFLLANLIHKPKIHFRYKKMDIKKCPFCAEEIKAEAIKCKFCKSEFKKVVERIHFKTFDLFLKQDYPEFKIVHEDAEENFVVVNKITEWNALGGIAGTKKINAATIYFNEQGYIAKSDKSWVKSLIKDFNDFKSKGGKKHKGDNIWVKRLLKILGVIFLFLFVLWCIGAAYI